MCRQEEDSFDSKTTLDEFNHEFIGLSQTEREAFRKETTEQYTKYCG